MFAAVPPLGPFGKKAEPAADLDLSVLLARALLAFTLEAERESPVSLTISASVLRVVGADGTRVRDLPRLAGVSREGIAAAAGVLRRDGLLPIDPGPGGAKTARLTPAWHLPHHPMVLHRGGWPDGS